jgi:hypothetical protein
MKIILDTHVQHVYWQLLHLTIVFKNTDPIHRMCLFPATLCPCRDVVAG